MLRLSKRNTCLYLGLSPNNYQKDNDFFQHLPLIQTTPLPLDYDHLIDSFLKAQTAIITSKTTVAFLFDYFKQIDDLSIKNHISHIDWISIGDVTSVALKKEGALQIKQVTTSTSEGIVTYLEQSSHKSPFFYPHSKLSRDVIASYLKKTSTNHDNVLLYETRPLPPSYSPDFQSIRKIVFTSPSVVDAFLLFFPPPSKEIILEAIGPITKKYLESKLKDFIIV